MFWIRTLFLAYTLFVVMIVVSATLGWFPAAFTLARSFTNDKVLHFGLVGTLALLLNLSLRGNCFGILPLGTAIILVVATTEEISQIWFTHRTFDSIDLVSNYLGILTLGTLGCWLRPKTRTRNDQPVGHNAKRADMAG